MADRPVWAGFYMSILGGADIPFPDFAGMPRAVQSQPQPGGSRRSSLHLPVAFYSPSCQAEFGVVSGRLEIVVTPAQNLDGMLRTAIANRRLLRLHYQGRERIVEPHDYGRHNGVIKLLAWQVGGASSGPLPNWRWMDAAQMLRRREFSTQRSPTAGVPRPAWGNTTAGTRCFCGRTTGR